LRDAVSRPLARAAFLGWATVLSVALALAHCAVPVPDPIVEEDGGIVEEDGGPVEEDGGPVEVDGGTAGQDGGPDGGALRDGGRDAGADAGPDGGRDGGVADGGADAGADGGTTTAGASKIFESTDLANPSAFDFAAERAVYLASEASPTLADFFLFSLEIQTGVPADNDDMTFVSARLSTQSGGERGTFKATGIEDLSADGGVDPATFSAIPASLVFREATKTTTHRVPVVVGHVYAFQLTFGSPTNNYAAVVVDRIVTPVADGGPDLTKQSVEFRWLYQTQAGRRTFDRTFPAPP
jgi:hypothetical protein